MQRNALPAGRWFSGEGQRLSPAKLRRRLRADLCLSRPMLKGRNPDQTRRPRRLRGVESGKEGRIPCSLIGANWSADLRHAANAVNGILWVLRTGAPWRDMPSRYGNRNSMFVRFTRWSKQSARRVAESAASPRLRDTALESTAGHLHVHSPQRFQPLWKPIRAVLSPVSTLTGRLQGGVTSPYEKRVRTTPYRLGTSTILPTCRFSRNFRCAKTMSLNGWTLDTTGFISHCSI